MHILLEIQQILDGVLGDELLNVLVDPHPAILPVNAQQPIIEDILKSGVIARIQPLSQFLHITLLLP